MEEEEEVKPKVVPLSLEELLAKKKAEQEALSKVTFITCITFYYMYYFICNSYAATIVILVCISE